MNHPNAEHGRPQGEHEKDNAEGRDPRVEDGRNTGHAGVDVADQARNNVQNEAADRTNHAVQENDHDIDTLLEGVPHEHVNGEENATDKMPKYEQFFKEHEKATKAIMKNYTTALDSYYRKWPLLAEKGFQITPEKVKKLLNSNDANLVGILDYRISTQPDDLWDQKIKGSLNYPLPSGPSDAMLQLGELIEPTDAMKTDHIQHWAAELEKGQSPFRALASKPIVIVHCLQSTERTPNFSAGYLRYVAEPLGQKVVILKGGFEEFNKIGGALIVNRNP